MFLYKVYTGNNQWFLYIFTLLIVFLALQLGSIPLAIYLIIKDVVFSHPQEALSTISNTNLGLALMLLPHIAGFVALLFCIKHIHKKPIQSVITARPQISWHRVWFAAGIWSILGLSITLIPLLFASPDTVIFQFNPSKFIILLLISICLFPFQATFEELIFRGYLMQWFAYLFKYRWIAILLTSILFGLMHGNNPEIETFGVGIAMSNYIILGLILSYITVKDNGMELAIGFHTSNNILSALTTTSEGTTLQTHALFKLLNPTASWLDVLIILLVGLIFIWICNKKYHFIRQNNLWQKIPVPSTSNDR